MNNKTLYGRALLASNLRRFGRTEDYRFQNLVLAAEDLFRRQVPANGWTDDGTAQTGHWHTTLYAMKQKLNRRLTEAEITVLSLGRAYGPCPGISDAEASEIADFLFPEGNHTGRWYGWETLAERLLDFACLKDDRLV